MGAFGPGQVKERPLAARVAARRRRVLELPRSEGKLAAMKSKLGSDGIPVLNFKIVIPRSPGEAIRGIHADAKHTSLTLGPPDQPAADRGMTAVNVVDGAFTGPA
jgi:hypothetical protein